MYVDYQKIFISGPIPKSISTINTGIFIEANDAFLNLVKYTREELIGTSTLELGIIKPETRLYVLELMKKDGFIKNEELQITNKLGKKITGLFSAEFIEVDNENCLLTVFVDITEKKENDLKLKLANDRLQSLFKISQLHTETTQELLDYALEEAIKLTGSKIGYIYFYNEQTKQFTLNTWSNEVMSECNILEKQTIYDLDKTGCWGDAVRLRNHIIVNDYANETTKKGTPEGHVKLKKFLTVPVIFDNKIVAVIGVANKETNYDAADVTQLTLLMDNVWKIVERTEILETLKNNEDQLSLLFENMNLGLAYHKMLYNENGEAYDYMFIKSNKAFSELTKLTNVEGKLVTELIPDIKKTNINLFEIYGRVAKGGKPEQIEFFFEPLNEWFTVTVYSPKPEHFAVIFDVITKKSLLEINLKESESRFKNIFNKSPIGIAMYDADGNLKDANDALLNIFSVKNIKPLKKFNLFHQKYADDIKKALNKTHYYEQIVTYNFDDITSIETSAKGIRHFKMMLIKYKFNGESYMAMVQDVTEQETFMNKIQENEEKFKNLYYKSPVGIELYNEDGILQDVNEECLDMFGVIDPNELKKLNLFEVPNLPSDVKQILEETGKFEGSVTFDFDVVRKQNLYQTTKKGLSYFYVIITKQDISKDTKYIAQIQNETEYIQQNAQLLELNQTKDKFFSIISHDLKSPFNAILGFTDLLTSNYYNYTDEEKIKYLKNIKDSTTNAYELLQNLLDWAASQASNEPVDAYYLDSSIVVSEAIQSVSAQALLKNIKIYSDVNFKTECFSNEDMLSTIIRNLLSNAIKFTNRGGNIIVTSNYIEKDKRYLRLCVRDNGIGMDAELKNRLFKIGEKIRKIGTEYEKGTGLGLIICKEFVTKLGGEIWAESTPDKGSSFYITMPAKKY